jgi:hypothetical protein
MATKLRIIVSSTMKDLANERHAVTDQIERFNFEPVNAEAWSPDGSKSWETIEKELLSSHLVVLLLGERYGHIPGTGPGAADLSDVLRRDETVLLAGAGMSLAAGYPGLTLPLK